VPLPKTPFGRSREATATTASGATLAAVAEITPPATLVTTPTAREATSVPQTFVRPPMKRMAKPVKRNAEPIVG
jgi:hypothetical protein